MLENKVVRVLLSVCIAFGLWLYVITAVSTEYDLTIPNVPVVFQGEALLADRGLMVTAKESPKVTLQLYGKRSDLSKLDSSNLSVIVDLSKIGEVGTHNLNTSNISYPVGIRQDSITVLNRTPSTITLTVENKISKEIPVNIGYIGNVPEDLIADKDNAVLDYSMVSITGPESVIDQITQARIEVDLENHNVSFSESYRFTLCDKDGNPVDAALVETNVAQVNLTLYIQRIKEIPLRVEVVAGGGATENTSVIELSHQTIKVSGSESVLDQFDELTVGTLDLGMIPDTTNLTFPVVLPAGVTNISAVSEVQVTVRFPALATKSFTVTDITAINVPEGTVAEILTQTLQVTIRGPRDLMSTMTEENISVLVDFTDAQPGTFTVKGNVVLDPAYSGTGAIKSDSISVTLRSAMEPLEDDAEGNG